MFWKKIYKSCYAIQTWINNNDDDIGLYIRKLDPDTKQVYIFDNNNNPIHTKNTNIKCYSISEKKLHMISMVLMCGLLLFLFLFKKLIDLI